ncbi:hypothetical protein L208DRAFT_1381520 [Tricholoma matsutake]|nr:hypothetical protein L208DRAFT_1381520 [Tricholoma matsutake 945]
MLLSSCAFAMGELVWYLLPMAFYISHHRDLRIGCENSMIIGIAATYIKLELPIHKSEIHPLATSGKNKVLISDLKDGLVDFLDQMGQKDGDYDCCLWFAGGNGMSYNNMLTLKKYLQTHKDVFQRFKMMQPVLQAWHTMWMDLSCICETHWGEALDNNPATIGWSVKKIDRAPPTNLKKVDYYLTAQLLSLVHNTQMLDAWSEWAKNIPLGTQWDGNKEKRSNIFSPTEIVNVNKQAISKKANQKNAKQSKAKSSDSPDPLFYGNHSFAEASTFKHDAMISREVAYAAAEGDVGQMWEGLKIMMFTFAGSGHSNYTGYLLEMICKIELESYPALREAFLMSLLVNPTGKRGSFTPGDIYQEDIQELKSEFQAGVGLAKRSGCHKDPQEKPEFKILLQECKNAELHLRQPGRAYAANTSDETVKVCDVDNM